MKKINLTLTILAVFLFQTNFAYAVVTVTVGSSSASSGATNVEIPITVSDLTGLDVISADITLSYDPSYLSYSSFKTSGTLAANWSSVCNPRIPGQIKIALYGPAITGEGTLLKINFNVNPNAGFGDSPLHLLAVSLNGRHVPATTENGTLTVLGGVSQ
jgi:hypothetical protein